MADTPMMVDGKAARLRASCDACNESKVRCSQSKPACSRCQKQGVTCIYGLSRRSHRSAPRIGASIAPLLLQNQHFGSSASNSDVDEDYPQDGLSSLLALSPRDEDSEISGSFPTTAPLQGPLAFFDDFPASAFDFSMSPQSLFDEFGLRSPTITSQDFPYTHLGSTTKCACASRATTELMSILVLFNHEGNSIDVQLSSIKRAIIISQDCISCDRNCIAEELTIITITLLMGRVIQGFDATLDSGIALAAAARSGAEQGFTGSGTSSPPLTWGMLSIEGEEEVQLKQHLLLLNFQKLEHLLKQLNESVKKLRVKTESSNSTHAIACECIHMWLEQRAQLVKKKLMG